MVFSFIRANYPIKIPIGGQNNLDCTRSSHPVSLYSYTFTKRKSYLEIGTGMKEKGEYRLNNRRVWRSKWEDFLAKPVNRSVPPGGNHTTRGHKSLVHNSEFLLVFTSKNKHEKLVKTPIGSLFPTQTATFIINPGKLERSPFCGLVENKIRVQQKVHKINEKGTSIWFILLLLN